MPGYGTLRSPLEVPDVREAWERVSCVGGDRLPVVGGPEHSDCAVGYDLALSLILGLLVIAHRVWRAQVVLSVSPADAAGTPLDTPHRSFLVYVVNDGDVVDQVRAIAKGRSEPDHPRSPAGRSCQQQVCWFDVRCSHGSISPIAPEGDHLRNSSSKHVRQSGPSMMTMLRITVVSVRVAWVMIAWYMM